MDTKSTQRGFGHSELVPLIVILIILSAVAAPIAKKLGYHPGIGVLAVLALYAVYFIYLRIQDYLDLRELRGNESLTLTARVKRGITVLDVNGSLSVDNWEILHRPLTQLLNAGNKSILLNLAMVSHIDAAGLGLLVRLRDAARARGGELKLAMPSGQVRQALEVTRVADAIEIYSGEDEAVASFARSSRP